MAARNTIFTTIHTERALLPADLLQHISEGANIEATHTGGQASVTPKFECHT